MTKTLLTVDIEVEGDFPNRRELAIRNKLEKEFASQELGKFAGSGGGLGAMDLCYLVEDEQRARGIVERAIERHIPNAKYSIETEEFTGDESEFEEEPFEISIPRLITFLLQIFVVLSIVVFGLWKLISWLL